MRRQKRRPGAEVSSSSHQPAQSAAPGGAGTSWPDPAALPSSPGSAAGRFLHSAISRLTPTSHRLTSFTWSTISERWISSAASQRRRSSSAAKRNPSASRGRSARLRSGRPRPHLAPGGPSSSSRGPTASPGPTRPRAPSVAARCHRTLVSESSGTRWAGLRRRTAPGRDGAENSRERRAARPHLHGGAACGQRLPQRGQHGIGGNLPIRGAALLARRGARGAAGARGGAGRTRRRRSRRRGGAVRRGTCREQRGAGRSGPGPPAGPTSPPPHGSAAAPPLPAVRH